MTDDDEEDVWRVMHCTRYCRQLHVLFRTPAPRTNYSLSVGSGRRVSLTEVRGKTALGHTSTGAGR